MGKQCPLETAAVASVVHTGQSLKELVLGPEEGFAFLPLIHIWKALPASPGAFANFHASKELVLDVSSLTSTCAVSGPRVHIHLGNHRLLTHPLRASSAPLLDPPRLRSSFLLRTRLPVSAAPSDGTVHVLP